MDLLQRQTKLFRALLYLYPAEFRQEYGSEMEQLFADRLQSEPRLRIWLEALADIAFNASREHWHTLVSDVKYGTRVLAATPSFSLIAILVIALGIGSTVSVFSVVNAVLLRSLPYGHADKLAYLWSPNRTFKGMPDEIGVTIPDFYDWQRLSHSFTSMTLFRQRTVNVVGNGSTHRAGAAFVTGNFFLTLEAQPQLGRSLDANDDRPGHGQVAVISDSFWHAEFAGAANVLGKQIQLNRQKYSVVGVMPKGFGYPFDGDVPYDRYEFKQTDIWLPTAYTQAQKTNRANFENGDAIGRLREGVSVAAAQAELVAIESRLNPLFPKMWRGWTALVKPVAASIVGPVEQMLWLLFGAVGVVLLIAMTNLANLLLARSAARAHELGIRSALGADRARIIRQLLTESLLLSCTGGLLGVAFAYAAVRLLVNLNPGGIPRFEATSVDGRVLLVAILLAIGTGLLAGLLPAFSASKVNLNDLLKRTGTRIAGGANRSRFALIVIEVALSVILLTAAGLLIRSYLRLAAFDPGFSTATLTFQLTLDERYNRPDLQASFYRTFLDKLRNMPGIHLAGASSSLPLSDHDSTTFAEVRGFGKPKDMIRNRSVTPGYLKALGTPLLRGRSLDWHDIHSKNPVVLVNRKFAATLFPGRNPLGGQVRIGIGDLSKAPWSTVVGIVADIRHNSIDFEEASQPQLFQAAESGEFFAVVCSRPTQQVISQIHMALQSLDPVLTLSGVRTMGERVDEDNARRRFQTALLTGFAAIAVVLALAGLYGVMSYNVKQRKSEIGIRLAVGSSRAGVLWIILKQGLRVTVIGLLIGVAGAFAVTRLLSTWLFEIKATDPVTFIAVPAMILLVSLCACLIPAWSATKIDPIETLRQE